LEVDNVIKDRCDVVVAKDGGDQVNELARGGHFIGQLL